MKAVMFREPGKPLEFGAAPDPSPSAHEVILRVGRCGICGSDLHQTEEGAPPMRSGLILGHEISGEVVALGRDVQRLKVGDRVAALPIKGCGECSACREGLSVWCSQCEYIGGGFAEYARAGERDAIILPAGLSLADGAMVEPLAVALHAMRMVDLRGKHILVLGAGPIGLGVVFWARRFGAARIDVREGNADRRAMAMELGADLAEAPQAPPSSKDLMVLDHHAPEIVVECVGRVGLLQAAVAQVRPRGTVISLGVCVTPEPFLAPAAMRREVTMKFPAIYSLQDYQEAVDVLQTVEFGPRVMLTATIGLRELPQEFEALRRPTSQCKVMVDPGKLD